MNEVRIVKDLPVQVAYTVENPPAPKTHRAEALQMRTGTAKAGC